MENKLGRLLSESECVHHKNENGHDNSEDNLEVMSKSEHATLHARKRYSDGPATEILTCAFCGESFERRANQSGRLKGYNSNYCSRRCNGKKNGFRQRDVPVA